MSRFLPVVTANGVLVAIFYVGFTLAPRYITGAEVALILLMETVCGPLWVFLRFGDAPTMWTLVGGAILVTALAVHELLGMWDESTVAAVAEARASRGSPIDTPGTRLSASPPPPRHHVLPKAIAPESSANYQCFSDAKAGSQAGRRG